MTEELLASIDVVTSGPLVCALSKDEVRSELLRAHGFTAYADRSDWKSQTQYERSRWLRMEDGRVFPELLILAALKFGRLDGTWNPYWLDKNFRNATLANVTRSTVVLKQEKKTASPYGRAGTAEYRKEYYSRPENKQRLREQTKASAARTRALKKLVVDEIKKRRLAMPVVPTEEPVVAPLVENDRLAQLAQLLLGEEKANAVMSTANAVAPIPSAVENLLHGDPRPPCPRCGTDLEPTTGTCPWCGWNEDMFSMPKE